MVRGFEEESKPFLQKAESSLVTTDVESQPAASTREAWDHRSFARHSLKRLCPFRGWWRCCFNCFSFCLTYESVQRKFISLSEPEAEALEKLKRRAAVPFSSTDADHAALLLRYANRVCLIADCQRLTSGPLPATGRQLGFQSNDPSTDFRAGGILVLECMDHFADRYPDAFQNIIKVASRGSGDGAQLPFSTVLINIAFMLIFHLKLNSTRAILASPESPESRRILNGQAKPLAWKNFASIASEEQFAFEELFSACCCKLSAIWSASPMPVEIADNKFLCVLKVDASTVIAFARSANDFHVIYGRDLDGHDPRVCDEDTPLTEKGAKSL